MPSPTRNLKRRPPVHLEEAVRRVRELAERVGPGAQLPTTRELTRLLGVSLATLDRALTELEAQGGIDRHHGVGITVRQEIRQRTIGIVCGKDIFYAGVSPFWGLLVNALTRQVIARGQRADFYVDLPTPQAQAASRQELHDHLAARRLAGLLMLNIQSAEEVEELRAFGVPVVVFGSAPPHMVGPDNDGLIRAGVAALAARGCRRIGLLTTVARATGLFREAAAQRGVECDPRWQAVLDIIPPTDPTAPYVTPEERGYRVVSEWLAAAAQPTVTGLLSTDDILTRGAIVALERAGRRVGRDIQIATLANRGSPALLGHEDRLIRLETDPAAVAAAMVTMLDELLAGSKSVTAPVLVPVAVIEPTHS